MSNVPDLLKNTRTIAVVGLSNSPMRPSNGVSEYMKLAGYRIIPVNPNEAEVLGEKSYARLEDVPEKIDMVNVFRRPEHVPDIVESGGLGDVLQSRIIRMERKWDEGHESIQAPRPCSRVQGRAGAPYLSAVATFRR